MGFYDGLAEKSSGYAAGLRSFFWPAHRLKGPRQITLDRWDELNQKRKTVGIGELDNHATVRKFLGISIVTFPFRRAFRYIRTHVMTKVPFSGNSVKDIQLVFETIRSGSCYFALEYFREAKGFQFLIEQGDKQFFMGDTLKLSGNERLTVNVPEKALLRVVQNGREWKLVKSDQLSAQIMDPGVYRVEAFLKSAGKLRPWIFLIQFISPDGSKTISLIVRIRVF